MSQPDIVDRIFTEFTQHGGRLYVGEAVSQREHALQAALLAEEAGAPDGLVVAALLHDYGHLLHDLDEDCAEHGVDDHHDELAANALAAYFPADVVEPIRLHVASKRYLCAVDPGYLDELSPASRLSLALQGGPFSEAEVAAFAVLPHAADALRVRDWDDLAKTPGLATPTLEHYRPALVACRRSSGDPRPGADERLGPATCRLRAGDRGRRRRLILARRGAARRCDRPTDASGTRGPDNLGGNAPPNRAIAVSLTIYCDEIFLEHRLDGHPESPERLMAIVARLEGLDQDGLLWRGAAPPVSDAVLELVHPAAYWHGLRDACASGPGWLDADTYFTPASYEVARRAVGTAVECAARVRDDREPGFALIRPPGHHAEPSQAMGFCLFNNVAVAARAAQQRDGVDRVAIVDIDVHHGNGTQDVFIDDPTVLYCSIHQAHLYPGTGAATQRGRGAGVGTTVNIPLPAGTARAAWLAAFDHRIAPAVADFAPDLILVSAGFDAHTRDGLAEFDLITRDFGEIAARIEALAGATAAGASAWILEGGYSLQATADSCAAVVEVLRGPPGGALARSGLQARATSGVTDPRRAPGPEHG
jgi:phosphonate degradation associated HDIG domain protein